MHVSFQCAALVQLWWVIGGRDAIGWHLTQQATAHPFIFLHTGRNRIASVKKSVPKKNFRTGSTSLYGE
jgi:hypothetical protein